MSIKFQISVVLSGLAVLFASGCSAVFENANCNAGLKKYVPANARSDANLALRSGKRELLYVSGVGQHFPGAEDDVNLPVGFATRGIEYTSDDIPAGACERFNKAAIEYASSYNEVMLRSKQITSKQGSDAADLPQ